MKANSADGIGHCFTLTENGYSKNIIWSPVACNEVADTPVFVCKIIPGSTTSGELSSKVMASSYVVDK